MKVLSPCSEEQFKEVFNLRNFNPPASTTDFDDEFSSMVDFTQSFFDQHVPPGVFEVFPYQNQSRFIEVIFTTEDYLDADLLTSLQLSLQELPHDWMVCLWEACFVFVTKTKLFGFDPISDTEVFKRITT